MKELILFLTEEIKESAKKKTSEYYIDETESHTFMIAELHRNLGNFDECRRTLNQIAGPELINIISSFKKECDKGNKLVFRIG